MIRINLLAEGRGAQEGGGLPGPARPRRLRRKAGRLGRSTSRSSLLVVLGVGAYGGWLMYEEPRPGRTRSRSSRIELKKYEGAREKVAELEKKKDRIHGQAGPDQAAQGPAERAREAHEPARGSPPRGRLVHVRHSNRRARAISINGMAKSIKTISTLYDNLVATNEFGEVQLGDVAQQTRRGRRLQLQDDLQLLSRVG